MEKQPSLFNPVLIAGCLIILTGFSIRASFGVFQIPIEQEFQWLRVEFSLAIAIQNLGWGIGAPIFGALGENAISSISYGLGMATGSWVHTGEGGLAPYHTIGGGDVIMQIGSGIFGVRNECS